MAPVPPNINSQSDPIDFSRLAEVADGDHVFERHVLQVYLSDVEQRFGRIAAALDRNDFGTVLLESHSVKGASNNLGAWPLRQAAERCESASRASALSDCREALVVMNRELERLRVVVEAHLKKLTEG